VTQFARTLAVRLAGLFALIAMCGTAAQADPISKPQWHLQYLDITAAHAISRGKGVTVAVVDSGVDANHPDLAGSLVPGIDLTSAVDLSGSDPRGYTDIFGHGTGMAGLIASHGHTLGIAPEAKIQPVRVTTAGGKLDGSKTPEGLAWAATHGAEVINISSSGNDVRTLREAVELALVNDVVVVAAVGHVEDSNLPEYPAGYPGVLAVGAVDRAGSYAPFSISGPQVVITAPGVDITSPGLNGGYNHATKGTSDATAIVSGAVALIRSKYPNITAPEVIRLITSTADDKGEPGRDVLYGYGVINIVKALTTDPATIKTTAAPQPPPSESGPPASVLVGGGIIILALLAAAGATVIWRRSSRT
jgi:type VII secretion-associated serine protease mycosin